MAIIEEANLSPTSLCCHIYRTCNVPLDDGLASARFLVAFCKASDPQLKEIWPVLLSFGQQWLLRLS